MIVLTETKASPWSRAGRCVPIGFGVLQLVGASDLLELSRKSRDLRLMHGHPCVTLIPPNYKPCIT